MWGQPSPPVHQAQLGRVDSCSEVELASLQPRSGERMQPTTQVVGGSTALANKPQRGEREFTARTTIPQTPCPAPILRDFHRLQTNAPRLPRQQEQSRCWQNPLLVRLLQKMNSRIAPNPVTGLWTACTRLKTRVLTNADFSLTKKIGRVELNRSLTASKVFPVGAASGAQAESLF